MSIGSTIKMLRRKNDITQERLAELLNISASAVSQWETERVMPDLMQIPVLANVFNVSSDVIFGIDIEKKNEKIKEILDIAEGMSYNAEWQKEAGYLRDQLRLYPRAYQIMEKLADAIINDHSRRNINDYDEAVKLCNTVLLECTDNNIRYKALENLGFAYFYSGKIDDMMKIADQMPEFRFSKEHFLLWRMEGDEGLKQRLEYSAAIIEQIVTILGVLAVHKHDNGKFVYSKEDRIKLYQQLVGIIELLCPDGDYQIKAQHAEFACSHLSQMFFNDRNIDAGFHWLDKSCDYAICFDTYDFDAIHTSPALRGYSGGGWIMEDGCNHTACLLNDLIADSTHDEIKSDPRFINIINRLKQYTKNNK